MKAAQNCGWRVTGTEMNAEVPRAAGLPVGETLREVAHRGPFDCVTMWHSLEHISELQVLRNQIVDLMAPEARLIIAVPDAGGLQSRIFSRHWFHLDVPRHLHHFDGASLKAYLQGGSFQIERCYHQELEYDAMGWLQSALNRAFDEPNVLFEMVTNKQPRASLIVKTMSLVLGTLLMPAVMLAVAVGTLAGRGGTLITVARKG